MSQFPALAPIQWEGSVFRIRSILVAALAVGGLVATAAPAMAGDTPTPTPKVTTSPGCIDQCRGHHHHFLRPEQWDVNIADDFVSGLHVNDVSALGPVFIRGGTDNTLSDVLDQFADGNGNDVNVSHPALSLPTIDRRVCEATIVQTDQPWRFRGGDGLFRQATGFGVYNLNAEFSFQLRHGRCSLGSLSPQQVLTIILAGASASSTADTNSTIAGFCRRHHIPTPVLLADDVFVQGTGVAAVPRRHEPRPKPTATETVI